MSVVSRDVNKDEFQNPTNIYGSYTAFASLSLLGPTCVPDQHYQDLSPYWDLV